MAQWMYYNNGFILEATGCIPPGDLAVQRGYGIFDFFKTRAGTPVFLEDHLERFYHSAAALRLPVTQTTPELKAILYQLLERNALPESGVRLTLTGGLSPDGFSIATPNLLITQQPLQLPKADTFERGIRLALYHHQRQLPHVKTIDYLMALWLQPWLAAQSAEDILYHINGCITESPRANFFIVTKEGQVRTPGQHILKGITRAHIIRLASGYIAEGPVTLDDIASAAEAFITSTIKGVLPVTAIDGRLVGNGKPGAVTRRLASALETEIKNSSLQVHHKL